MSPEYFCLLRAFEHMVLWSLMLQLPFYRLEYEVPVILQNCGLYYQTGSPVAELTNDIYIPGAQDCTASFVLHTGSTLYWCRRVELVSTTGFWDRRKHRA